MKWFKHESRASGDAKLQKVMMKYGFEGYGLYWYCIESICSNLEPDLTFELEKDSEILAHVGNMDSRKVEEIMLYMVNLGLFEQCDSTVTCFKLARFLGESGTRSTKLREIIKLAKDGGNVDDCRRLSQTKPDSQKQSQIVSLREEKRREEKKNTGRFTPPTVEDVARYCEERGNGIDPVAFIDHYAASGWMRGKNKIKDWKACVRTWEQKRQAEQPPRANGYTGMAEI